MRNFLLKLLVICMLISIPLYTALSVRWFPQEVDTSPTQLQGSFFIFLSFFEAFGFILGILSLFFVRPIIGKTNNGQLRNYIRLMYYSLLWLLLSWWPHDWAHTHNIWGTWGLIGIEYIFHVTSLIAVLIVVIVLYKLIYIIKNLT